MKINSRLQNIPTHRGSSFTWIVKVPGAGGCAPLGVAEASDLRTPIVGRIWSDSCDEGFYLIGKYDTKLFVFDKHDLDAEGELISSTYTTLDGMFTVVIYND